MKQLAIDWGDLALAFDSSLGQMSHYLDMETGQVLAYISHLSKRIERQKTYQSHWLHQSNWRGDLATWSVRQLETHAAV